MKPKLIEMKEREHKERPKETGGNCMKMLSVLLGLLLVLGMANASMRWNPIDAKEAVEKQLYLREGNTAFFAYVGGTVEGYSISGYVPYVPVGKTPYYGTIYPDKKYEWSHLPRYQFG